MAVSRLLWSPLALMRAIGSNRPAIVHINTSLDAKAFWRDTAYLIIAKLLNRRVVYQVHGGALGGFVESFGPFRGILSFILKLPDQIVVLSRRELAAYEEFGVKTPLALIPNAISVDELEPENMPCGERGQIMFVYIGRLADDKGILEAIDGLAEWRRRRSETPFVFIIAGSGPAEARIREQIVRCGVGGAVRLIGPVAGKDKMDLWRKADIFLFPTYHQEGLPYAVLESLASGTPIVTTDVGGIPEAVEDGVHGIIVGSIKAHDISDAIERLVSSPELLHKMSVACVERARTSYGIDRLAAQFKQLYYSLVAASH